MLTHHLGWVATTVSNTNTYSDKPYNALWGQLIDLYGAIGHPAKVAHTVITGTNNGDLISKILNSLTYFIRCCDIERKDTIRVDVEGDNSLVNSICHEYSCIPKEYYKKYEDHLREMDNTRERENKNDIFLKNKKEEHKEHVVQVSYTNLPPTISKTTTIESQLSSHLTSEEKIKETYPSSDKKVVFLLGDDEKLESTAQVENNRFDLSGSEQLKPLTSIKKGMKKEISCFNLQNYVDNEKSDKHTTTETLCQPMHDVNLKNTEERIFENSSFKDEDFVKHNESVSIKPSTSFSSLKSKSEAGCSSKTSSEEQKENEFVRSKSVPPEQHKPESNNEIKSRYKYCGVKFNFQQYPQIVTNYMKSKNIELSRLPFTKKEIDFTQVTFNADTAFNFMDSDDSGEEVEALQTPSNASELECVSDLVTEKHKECYAKESVERLPKTFVKAKVPNTVIKESPKEEEGSTRQEKFSGGEMKIISLPMPK